MDSSVHGMCKDAQVNWDDLRFVLAIAREQNLSRAASSLGVAHTTVGRRVKTFEEELGVRLFDRTPEGFVLTPAGQDLQKVALSLEREVLDAENRLLGRDAQLEGRLRVSTLDFLFKSLSEHITSFIHRYPAVELTMVATNSEVSLNRREADVALRLSNSPLEYLVGRKVARLEFAVFGAAPLVDRVGREAPLGDYPWIHFDERGNTRWMDSWLAEHAPGAKVIARLSDSFMLSDHYLHAGLGIGFWPCFLGDTDPDLVRLSPRLTDFGRDLWLLTLPDLRTNSRIRAFMDHMEAALRPMAPAFEGEP